MPDYDPAEASAILTRRSWLGCSLRSLTTLVPALLIAQSRTTVARADGESPSARDGKLIVRTLRPLNLESPVSALDSWLTPNEQFFIRSHFAAPAVDLHPWDLEISGLVDRPARLSLAGLQNRAQVTLPAVLQCSGNGRSLFRPGMPGVGWVRGAVGHAEWSGVRLADLLEEARLQSGVAHVHLIGGDAPPSPRTPAFIRSIPIDRALDPNTLLGLRMNGVSLPALHGGPLRLVVPGWAGNNWIKWVRRIVVARDEAPGFTCKRPIDFPGRLCRQARPPNPKTCAGRVDEREVSDQLAGS